MVPECPGGTGERRGCCEDGAERCWVDRRFDGFEWVEAWVLTLMLRRLSAAEGGRDREVEPRFEGID